MPGGLTLPQPFPRTLRQASLGRHNRQGNRRVGQPAQVVLSRKAKHNIRTTALQDRQALHLAALIDHVGAADDQRIKRADALDILVRVGQAVQHIAHRI